MKGACQNDRRRKVVLHRNAGHNKAWISDLLDGSQDNNHLCERNSEAVSDLDNGSLAREGKKERERQTESFHQGRGGDWGTKHLLNIAIG